MSGEAPRPRRGNLRLVGRLLYYEQLNFWLNPIAALFTVGFAVVFLVLLASSAGNSTNAALGGVRTVQYYVPGFVAYGVMSTCFTSLATSLVVRRESGLLKRLRLSPLPNWAMIASICINALAISLVQVVVLLLIGRFAYGVHLPTDPVPLIVTILVGALSFTSIGIAVSTLVPNQEAAGPVISIVFFVLLFLSGLWYPLPAHSGLAQVSSYFPIRHMIVAVYAPFDTRPGAQPWAGSDLLIMGVWGVVGAAVAVRRWSWAPRRSSGRAPRSGRARGAGMAPPSSGSATPG